MSLKVKELSEGAKDFLRTFGIHDEEFDIGEDFANCIKSTYGRTIEELLQEN